MIWEKLDSNTWILGQYQLSICKWSSECWDVEIFRDSERKSITEQFTRKNAIKKLMEIKGSLQSEEQVRLFFDNLKE